MNKAYYIIDGDGGNNCYWSLDDVRLHLLMLSSNDLRTMDGLQVVKYNKYDEVIEVHTIHIKKNGKVLLIRV